MELATGRTVVGGRGSRNGGGSDAGGGRSSGVRDRDFDNRSDRDSKGRGGGRDYAREGARDRDRKEWGGSSSSKGGSSGKWPPRGGGGGGGGGSRHDGRDEGYRYLGQRDRSRSPPPLDRHKRPRVIAGSPNTDSRREGGGGSGAGRRDGKDKDRPRDSDRSRNSKDQLRGGSDGSRSRGNVDQSRGNADQHRSYGSSSSNGGAGIASVAGVPGAGAGAGDRRIGYHTEEAFVNGTTSGADGGGSGGRGTREEAAGGGGGDGSGSGNGDGSSLVAGKRTGDGNKVSVAAGGDARKSAPGEGGSEEGEVLPSSGGGAGDGRGTVTRNASGGRRREMGENSSERGGSGGRGGGSVSPQSSPRRGGGKGSYSPGGRRDDGGEGATKKVVKDRWADSDSEDEEEEGHKAAGGGKAPSAQANGASASAGGADGDKAHQNGRTGGGSGLLVGDRPEGGAGDGGGGGGGSGSGAGGDGSSRSKLDTGVGDLHQAMAGGKKVSVDGVSPRASEAGEVDKGSGGGEGGGGEGGGGGASATGGGGGLANGGRDVVPMTVFTRGEAAQDTYNPLLFGCRSVENYERITFIDEGAYGKVYCALNKLTGEVVALKQVKLTRDNGKEGFPITALRETNVLLSLHNPNIVRVLEMVIGSTLDKVYMVMEYFDHDLKSVMRHMREEKRSFSLGQVKSLVLQLLSAVEYMHRHWYIHRDLKTSNLLYNHQGKLAVCDFGLARKYEEPIRPYTSMVVTQWYRCPELLLGEKTYSTGVDMWSVGCIFGELVKGSPMFQGKSEIDQLAKIFGVLGSPTEDRWPGWSKLPLAKKVVWRQAPENQLRATFPATGFSGQASISAQGLDLLNGLLGLDPAQRMSAADALSHRWFTSEKPAPTPIGEMPQVDSKLDRDINKALAKWSKEQIGKQSARGMGMLQQRPTDRPTTTTAGGSRQGGR